MIIYGKQPVLYLLEHDPKRIQTLFLAKEIDPKLFSQMARVTDKICRVDAQKAQALARGGNHQGFIAQIEAVEVTPFAQLKQGHFLLILDELSDVGNIGAIIRSAYAFGADGVIISGVKQLNLEALLRTSSGAAFELPIGHYPSTKDMINELKQLGWMLYGADAAGKPLHTMHFSGRKALFLGSEGKGLSPSVKRKMDEMVSIKMARPFDSLNVSAAAAILCDRIANG